MVEKRAKLLVVDDQKDIVETLTFCFRQEGYEVVTAFDGHEALALARTERPDLIVLDAMLPKENGYQVARFIREDEKGGKLPKRTPILILTARAVPEKEREEFLRTWSGADVFMYKPFELEKLVDLVGNMLPPAASTV